MVRLFRTPDRGWEAEPSPASRRTSMFPVTAMPMPGALRLRALHPLIEGDGSCGLIYDLERGAVVEVPEELQFHIAPALEMGDLDETVLGWLVNEDLHHRRALQVVDQ